MDACCAWCDATCPVCFRGHIFQALVVADLLSPAREQNAAEANTAIAEACTHTNRPNVRPRHPCFREPAQLRRSACRRLGRFQRCIIYRSLVYRYPSRRPGRAGRAASGESSREAVSHLRYLLLCLPQAPAEDKETEQRLDAGPILPLAHSLGSSFLLSTSVQARKEKAPKRRRW